MASTMPQGGTLLGSELTTKNGLTDMEPSGSDTLDYLQQQKSAILLLIYLGQKHSNRRTLIQHTGQPE